MGNQDIRWKQRFKNYEKAFQKLEEAVLRIKTDFFEDGEIDENKFKAGDDIIKEGLIQRFEYTHELAWNVMKDFLMESGATEIYGSKDAIREAYKVGLIANGKMWMDMVSSRNRTSHTYNEEVANEIFSMVINEYYLAFLDFKNTMDSKQGGIQSDIFND
ncbi:nucleotidyltransferase substrate binding protein, HI0074 family [Algoriphagus locisalis]|uniref:Nucleotidyltransferase substrate binding protein, HI0074 family n=1 Tax=Algoriphagus locisalis TaxID=305507 RepID=A0A1I7AS40_9BACT|nr:nucleotidyltransferase substrate binding protein [Algoriphagus locisalis]SFT77728.1 nucleotidyltransferase substrate binding protein, HI0074 family [Algoriphagus locisalis]